MQKESLLSILLTYAPKILEAFSTTMYILLIALAISLILGALIAISSLSKKKFLNRFAKGYISFIRGIPTLILIFLIYLGLPQMLKNAGIIVKVSTITYIVVCLGISTSANMAEMMRTSYLSVDKGQREAAQSIGMKDFTAFRRIVFPQAFGTAIPTIGNNIIILFKETSLAFTVGVLDMLGKARAISAASFGANRLELYMVTGIIFWIICVIFETSFKYIEKIYTKGRKQSTS